ncbi:unnamed protein product [Durusdinium trenchii]|uniref:Uncharacterized protein n=1 Tax=Durusdinium trenchii TaxID=1381693 RepID=A0ABP0MVQ7_9DINO
MVTWMLIASIWLPGLGRGETVDDCSGCGSFPRVCDEVEHCIEHCGSLHSYAEHCAKLRAFEANAVNGQSDSPIRRAEAQHKAQPAALQDESDERTVMKKMMSPGGCR